ncbi:winged helix-turn-helix domain-containing protein [Phytoactinopolyspora limicola]|uniref:winged helix-turn-helix domain-containing protein n=1 Tax=Phytoactinopolyspora limicola TaxID=2715536 RepID=UPI00140C018C|nr:winged helix-turn-helix domain-containing protein [Phytoactinopolyspora limicola]
MGSTVSVAEQGGSADTGWARVGLAFEHFEATEVWPRYLFEMVADHLATLIESRELAPGSRFPSEHDFAAELGVSIGTVRRATQVLRERGLVRTFRARGTYVVGPSASASTSTSGSADDDVRTDG